MSLYVHSMPSLGSSGSCVSEELAVELDELLVLLEELPDGGSGAELDALLPAEPLELDGGAGVSPPLHPTKSAAASMTAVMPHKIFFFDRTEITSSFVFQSAYLIVQTFCVYTAY